MLLAKLPFLAASSLAAALLSGCCCPAISGRYCEVGMEPPSPAVGPCGDHCDTCGPGVLHRGIMAGRPHLLAKVPSQQHADYVSPLAKFHPVPTRPVFAPLPGYHPPTPLDPVGKPDSVAIGRLDRTF